jgi:hypothetical protein
LSMGLTAMTPRCGRTNFAVSLSTDLVDTGRQRRSLRREGALLTRWGAACAISPRGHLGWSGERDGHHCGTVWPPLLVRLLAHFRAHGNGRRRRLLAAISNTAEARGQHQWSWHSAGELLCTGVDGRSAAPRLHSGADRRLWACR